MRVNIWSISPEHRSLRGDEAADMREQCDEGDLAHVGGFAAHVGAGDEQRATRVVERGVVGRELIHLCFHHRMPAFDDVDLRIIAELWRAVIQRGGALGEGGEHVQFGDSGGDALQLRNKWRELVEQLFVEEFFACQCAVVGRERLVLEGFQFRRDVTLGVLQRLAAAVIVRYVD